MGKASGTPVSTYMYSEGGLFGSCKNDPVLINALVGPMGYEAKLQFQPTSTENPIDLGVYGFSFHILAHVIRAHVARGKPR